MFRVGSCDVPVSTRQSRLSLLAPAPAIYMPCHICYSSLESQSSRVVAAVEDTATHAFSRAKRILLRLEAVKSCPQKRRKRDFLKAAGDVEPFFWNSEARTRA